MIKEVKMKKKRKWWLWIIIAFACVIITFGVAELTGASVASVFGWGILGILGFMAVTLGLMLVSIIIVVPIAGIIRALLTEFISNKEIVYIILGGLGFSAILVGWILTTRQVEWSVIVMMVGFALGCFAGVEYHKHSLSVSHESERVIEQIPNKTREND
jgi:hypothetical protein